MNKNNPTKIYIKKSNKFNKTYLVNQKNFKYWSNF